MNADWQKMLISFGAELTDGELNYRPEDDKAGVLSTLAGVTILHVSGDAEAFLQDQFSNDIALLATPGSQLNTWSTPKGRVITLFRVIKVADGLLIKISSELVELMLKRLRMLAQLPVLGPDGKTVITLKVVFEPRDDLIAIGVSGEGAMKALAAHGISMPENVDDTAAMPAGGWITRVRGDFPRFEIIANAEQLSPLWEVAMDTCRMADESAWRLQNIDAGVPSVNAATSEEFVLQMMNLQLINGVSFKKGCYPGQEIVARMHYLGKLKRSMFRLQCEGNAPNAGDEIFKAGGGSAAGKVVDAVQAADNTTRMLAVLAIDATTEPLFLDKEAKRPLQLLEMPYALTPPE